MRAVDAAFATAIASARDRGLVPRRFVWIEARNRASGDPAPIGFWTGADDVAVRVISSADGTRQLRTFIGGVGLEVGAIARTSKLTIETVRVKISPHAESVKQLTGVLDARLARAEIHVGLLDPATRQLVGDPEPEFFGELNGIKPPSSRVGINPVLELEIVSWAIRQLTRGNHARDTGNLMKYANSGAQRDIIWGGS